VSSRIAKLKRKARQAREREELLKGFSIIFPECRELAFDRSGNLEVVFCLDCGSCLIKDLKENCFTVGVWIFGEGSVESMSEGLFS